MEMFIDFRITDCGKTIQLTNAGLVVAGDWKNRTSPLPLRLNLLNDPLKLKKETSIIKLY